MFIRDRVILPPELLVKLHFDSPVLQTVPTFRARKPETGYTALGLQGGQIRASKWANSEYRTHFVLAIPLAIGVNVLRITGTALIAVHRQDLAMGFYHSFSGWLTFVISLLILFAIGKGLMWAFE